MKVAGVIWLVIVAAAGVFLLLRLHDGLEFQSDLLALLPQEDRDPGVQYAKLKAGTLLGRAQNLDDMILGGKRESVAAELRRNQDIGLRAILHREDALIDREPRQGRRQRGEEARQEEKGIAPQQRGIGDPGRPIDVGERAGHDLLAASFFEAGTIGGGQQALSVGIEDPGEPPPARRRPHASD